MSASSAHLALLCGAFIFSGYNIVLSHCLDADAIGPVAFSLARELCSICVMYLAAATIERPLRWPSGRRDAVRFAALGCLLAAFQLCFTAGIALTDAMTAAVFQCIQPTTAALLGAVSSERLSASKVASALLAGAGVALIELNPVALAEGRGAGSGAAQPPAGGARALGCMLLFLQGVGIAAYCLVQKRLVREPARSRSRSLPRAAAEGGAGEEYGAGEAPGALMLTQGAPGSSALLEGEEAEAGDEGATGYGPLTVTAHAYCASTAALLLAAAVDTAAALETLPPLSRAQLAAFLASPFSFLALAYAVLLASLVGYSLGAWANARLDASTVVLYNATQPPITALLGRLLGLTRGRKYGLYDSGGTALVMLAVLLSSGALVAPFCCRGVVPLPCTPERQHVL